MDPTHFTGKVDSTSSDNTATPGGCFSGKSPLMHGKPLPNIKVIKIAQASRKAAKKGFVLLGTTLLLWLSSWLLLFSWEQSRQQALQWQQQQRDYWQSLTQSQSALAIAPYLIWQPASQQWQCQPAAKRQICLKQRSGDPTLALLRVTPLTIKATDRVTLYRWAKQLPREEPCLSSTPVPNITLHWVAGGWLDSCPEAEPYLCH